LTVCRNTVNYRKIPYVVVGILDRTQSLADKLQLFIGHLRIQDILDS